MAVKSLRQLEQASELANSVAAQIDDTLTRGAPAGAIQEMMTADMRYAEGVRDALAWASGAHTAADALARLLDDLA